jgi:gluconolactonase
MSLFAPPQRIATTVLTRLPDRLRKPVRTDWADANKGGDAVDSFLEGPCLDAQGRLLCTDIPHGRIFRIDAQGNWEVIVDYGGEPNGMKMRADGSLLVTDYRMGLIAFDRGDATPRPVLVRRHSESFRGVNDLCLAANGDVYFTDQGQTGLHDPTGRVYRLRADGQLDLLLANVPSPNGVVLDCAEKILFVAATRGNEVWRVPLQPDGGISKVGRFVSLYGVSGPDGLAMSSRGELCVAHASLGAVFVFAPSGEPLWRLDSCAGPTTTNLVLGGVDGRTAYITEASTGTILTARLP